MRITCVRLDRQPATKLASLHHGALMRLPSQLPSGALGGTCRKRPSGQCGRSRFRMGSVCVFKPPVVASNLKVQ